MVIRFVLFVLILTATSLAAPPKRFKLCAEILSGALEDPRQEATVQTLEKGVTEYGIDELMIHGFRTSDWVTYADFPKVAKPVDQARVEAYRRQLQRFKRLGVKIILSGGGPSAPADLFEQYPETRWFGAGQFQKFIESGTAEVLRRFPEADGLEIYLWETPLLNDADIFKGMGWLPHDRAFAAPAPWMSPAHQMAELLSAYARGAKSVGRQFLFLTFAHHPWQERLVIDALKLVDRETSIFLDHKNQPGDWSPLRPANNVMLEIKDRRAMLLFDGAGEYWGQSRTPYCYPEEIQQRLLHAIRENPSIETLGMRVHWANGNAVFGNFNEVNWYALSRLAIDPQTPIEDIWSGWAVRRFGKQAAPAIVRALERTNTIGNLTYYLRGAWVHNHSALSDLTYMESHIVQYGTDAIDYNPADFRTAALLREVIENPRERTVAWAVGDRREALRLNRLSLDDIESVRTSLPPAEYAKLQKQFTFQRHFIETSIPHMEAFLRYRIEKKQPSKDNRAKLDLCLGTLLKKAQEVETLYQEKESFLTAAAIRRYVTEIRNAVGKVN